MKFYPCRPVDVCNLALVFLTIDIVSLCNAQSLRRVQRSHGGHLTHNHALAAISALQMQTAEESVDMCRGKKYQWMLKINKRCRRSFGAESHWDINRGQGDYCKKGRDKCITSYYVECCSREDGAKKLKDYCKILDTEEKPPDPACRFQPTITKINNEINEMTKTADEVVNPKPQPSTPMKATNTTNTTSTTPTYEIATTTVAGRDVNLAPVPAGFVPAGAAPAGAAPAGAPPTEAAPPPSLEDQASVEDVSPADSSVAASPAAAPVGEDNTQTATTVHPPNLQHQEKVQDQQEEDSEKQEAAEADQKKSACERFVQASQRVQVLVEEFKKMKDLEEANEDLDPDLAREVNRVIAVGSFLQEQQQPCQVVPAPKDTDEDDGDDSDSDSEEEDLPRTAEGKSQKSSEDEEDNDEENKKNGTEAQMIKTGNERSVLKANDLEIEDPTQQVVVVVHVKVFYNLTTWVTQMSSAIQDVETKVHPNGRKWWRYRYEYTMVEAIFMAISILGILALSRVLAFLDRQSPPEKLSKVLEFRGTGLYRVAFWMFLMGSGSIACLFLVYWVFSYTGIFDWLAIVVQNHITARRTPFLGISYYLTLTDVLMHLFGGFLVYELLIVQVIREIRIELYTWRMMEGDSPTSAASRNRSRGLYVGETYVAGKDLLLVGSKPDFDSLEQSFLERIETSQVYGKALRDVNLHAFTDGFVTEEDKKSHKFHLYLTLYMGECIYVLCGMAIPTMIMIILTIFSGAFICWVLKMDLIMFLIPLNVVLVAVLILMYLVSRRIVRSMLLTNKLEPNYLPHKYVTPRKFCQVVQVILFHVSYAYTRIILSYDFIMEKFWMWVLVTVSFIVLYALFAWVGAEVVNHMLACLSLPPYIPPTQLADHMKELHDWQTEEKRQKETWRGVK